MKFCLTVTVIWISLLFPSACLSEANVREDENNAAIFGRSARFSNTLCFPLLDRCNRNSKVAFCGGLGDPCSDGVSSCAKTIEGGVVCVVSDDDDGAFCISSKDCDRE